VAVAQLADLLFLLVADGVGGRRGGRSLLREPARLGGLRVVLCPRAERRSGERCEYGFVVSLEVGSGKDQVQLCHGIGQVRSGLLGGLPGSFDSGRRGAELGFPCGHRRGRFIGGSLGGY